MQGRILLLAVIVMLAVHVCGCVQNSESLENTIFIKEFVGSFNTSIHNKTKTYTYFHTSLNDGDEFILVGKIDDIIFQNKTTAQWTEIRFESLPDQPPMLIEGDIRDQYRVGDTLKLRLHIMNVTVQQNDWTFHLETIKESYNLEENTVAPIPQKHILDE